MKRLLFATALMTFAGFSSAYANDQVPNEKEVVVGINDAYVPGGFDSNADVYVVTTGIFPNGCYRFSRADVSHKSAFEHEVKIIAAVKQGMCLMVLVPFNREVRLGKFERGEHTLRFLHGDGTYFEKSLVIE